MNKPLIEHNSTELLEVMTVANKAGHNDMGSLVRSILLMKTRYVLSPICSPYLRNQRIEPYTERYMNLLDFAAELFIRMGYITSSRTSTVVFKDGQISVNEMIKFISGRPLPNLGFVNTHFHIPNSLFRGHTAEMSFSVICRVSKLLLDSCTVSYRDGMTSNALHCGFLTLFYHNLKYLHLSSCGEWVSPTVLKSVGIETRARNGGLHGLCLEGDFPLFTEASFASVLNVTVLGKQLKKLMLIFVMCRDSETNVIVEVNPEVMKDLSTFPNLSTIGAATFTWKPSDRFFSVLLSMTNLEVCAFLTSGLKGNNDDFTSLKSMMSSYSKKIRKRLKVFVQSWSPEVWKNRRFSIIFTEDLVWYPARKLFFDEMNYWTEELMGHSKNNHRFHMPSIMRGEIIIITYSATLAICTYICLLFLLQALIITRNPIQMRRITTGRSM